MNNGLINELSTNFIEYAAAVNTDRAIPDAKSGLKPVARRILYGAFSHGRTSSKPHVKCARIVGEVMGELHPHGDSSIYGALVRLAQDWTMRYPLLDFHGNLGSIAGDGEASMRYTEARLSKLSEEGLLKGLKKKNVDFIPNYDESTEEPITLPASFPNLLCNPNMGIGVALACNWLPHNLKEVANAIYDYMDGKEPTLPGPDFPTGGQIINKNDLPNIIKTGHGSVKVRARYKLEKNNIVFYEIPYGVSTEPLLKQIGELCDEKEIEGIEDIRDESNKKGLRIVIECAKGENPDVIAHKLYAKSNLQTSISYNQVALVDKVPTELGLKDCIKVYIDHNKDCIIREANFDLAKAKDRLEVVDGLLKALEDIDNIIALIKQSKSAADAHIALMDKYKFTEKQSKAILDMKLAKLANLEKIELQNEQKELTETVMNLQALLSNEDLQLNKIKENLDEIVKKFGDERRTELSQLEVASADKEVAEVVPEDVIVILTKGNTIKRVPKKSFRKQNRGGKGFKSGDDTILYSRETNTIDKLLLFSNEGKMYQVLVDKIPSTTNAGKGVPVSSLIKIDSSEKIIAATSLERDNDYKYIAFFTKNGLLKKSELSEYNVKRSVVQAIKLKENDSIVTISFLKDKEDVMIFTRKGMAIHFGTSDISPIGRVAMGVKAIKLGEEDEVVNGFAINSPTEKIAIATTNGYGKIVEQSEFSLQGRYGKGIKCTNGEEVAGVELVEDNENILINGTPNSICVAVADFGSSTSRTAVGKKIINGSTIKSLMAIKE